ncbi:MAG: glycosyl transferase, partial [Alphaproteobacteria bacterium]
MSAIDSSSVALEMPAGPEVLPDSAPAGNGEIRVQGKFFFAGNIKHFVKGVTYGPFGPGSHGAQFPEVETVAHDFALMRSAGANTVRVFTVPPVWLLDAAEQTGLKVLVGLPWSQHV